MDGTGNKVITRCKFFAKKDILEGEELTIDEKRPGSVVCLCGSDTCQKTILKNIWDCPPSILWEKRPCECDLVGPIYSHTNVFFGILYGEF